MARVKMDENIQVEHSSGNVFADLGLPNPEEHLVKATIALAIAKTIRERELTQEQAGRILGLAQPKVSNLILRQFRFPDRCGISRRMRAASDGLRECISRADHFAKYG